MSKYQDKHHNNEGLKIYEKTHGAKAMVLTCIDYRFIDNVISFLESGPLTMNYDFTTVAGASLGVNQKKHKCWSKTFLDQVDLAIELHHIEEVIVFDHIDCGAYKMFYPEAVDINKEYNLHVENIGKFIKKIKKLYPDLKTSGYLLHLNGQVQFIA